jgi:hypothetical protein
MAEREVLETIKVDQDESRREAVIQAVADDLSNHPEIAVLFTDVGLPGGINRRQLAEEARNNVQTSRFFSQQDTPAMQSSTTVASTQASSW